MVARWGHDGQGTEHGGARERRRHLGEKDYMGSSFKTQSWEHQTRLRWHRMRPVPTKHVRRELQKISRPPDARLASGAAKLAPRNHQTRHTEHAQGTVREYGACCTPGIVHRTHKSASGAASGALPELDFQRMFTRLSPTKFQLQEDSNKHQLELV